MAGVQTAKQVVLLCGPSEATEPRLADSYAIILSCSVETLLKEENRDNFAIYEFIFPENLGTLDSTPCNIRVKSDAIVSLKVPYHLHFPVRIGGHVGFRPNADIYIYYHLDISLCACVSDLYIRNAVLQEISREEEVKAAYKKMRTPIPLMPRYGAGRVIVPSMLGALYAQAYSTPGILELAEALTMPSRRRQVSHPWLIDVPREFHGKSYETLAEVTSPQHPKSPWSPDLIVWHSCRRASKMASGTGSSRVPLLLRRHPRRAGEAENQRWASRQCSHWGCSEWPSTLRFGTS